MKCEVAVNEADDILKTAKDALEKLKNEILETNERIPGLEAEKKAAAAKRNFKAAGKASKEIKEVLLRKERCMEEISEEANEQVSVAKEEKEKLFSELKTKKALTQEKEKDHGIKRMLKLRERIQQLKNLKTNFFIDGFNEKDDSIGVVSANVLEKELIFLKIEGEAIGSKFGSW